MLNTGLEEGQTHKTGQSNATATLYVTPLILSS